jgi:hypothetical protein
VVIVVENEAAGPGPTTAFVSVSAYTTTNDVLNGANFPLDVGPAGNALPPWLTFNSTPIQNSILSNPALNTGFNPFYNIDGIANTGGGPNITLSNNPLAPTKLFDLVFDIDISAPLLSLVPVNILQTTSPVNNQYSIAPNAPSTVVNGSLLITVVPESAPLISCAMGLFLASAVGMTMWRRRKAAALR